ncbi:MAG: hypothetical protein EPO61_02725 [Nitrospirae bacterium]|nr:MAG: hypothetical protein EPO61_02725 [Nitrospirota bacterium]
MKTLLIAMVGLVCVVGMVGMSSPSGVDASAAATNFVGGTIKSIDWAGLKVTIQIDRGKTESLPVASIDLMKGLTEGDHVSVEVELDEMGKVLKVVKIIPDGKDAPEPKG